MHAAEPIGKSPINYTLSLNSTTLRGTGMCRSASSIQGPNVFDARRSGVAGCDAQRGEGERVAVEVLDIDVNSPWIAVRLIDRVTVGGGRADGVGNDRPGREGRLVAPDIGRNRSIAGGVYGLLVEPASTRCGDGGRTR